MTSSNFEIIEENIKRYKYLNDLLNAMQLELEENALLLKSARKNGVSLHKKNDEIAELNQRRNELKDKISETKKQVKQIYSETEQMIFTGIRTKYSEVYEKQLSRLYGYNIDVLIKNPGDYYDEETCLPTLIMVTKNRAQHKKVVKMIDFGIRVSQKHYTEKKARVEICVFSKKHKAGEVIPFDNEILK